jgi:hypothetical protein
VSMRIAWAMWALCALIAMLTAAIGIAFLAIGEPGHGFDALSVVAPMLAYPTVGVLVLSRRGNNIGWAFCATGVALAFTWVGDPYGQYTLFDRPGSLPGGIAAVWLSDVGQLPAFSLLGMVLLLFPEGRPRSRRGRHVLRMLGATAVLGALGYALVAGPFEAPFDKFRNPTGIVTDSDALGAVAGLLWFACLGGAFAAAVSLVRRLRRARGVERLQLKWVVFAGAVLAAVFLIGFPTFFFEGVPDAVERLRGSAFTFASAGIPVAAGIAILRYRLYEIDAVINRALVYAGLTATLAAAYVGSVLLLQLALDPVTSGSSLAVAVSTLAVAALFRPARGRIQRAVDRSFYRHKYDAARTLEGFSARMREQVNLDALGGELREVVRETMQPAHVSLWLRREQGTP